MALNRRNTPLPKFGERFDLERHGGVLGGSTLAIAFGLTPEEAIAAAQPKPEKMYAQKGDRIYLIRGDYKNQMLRPEMLNHGDKPVEGFPIDPKTEVLRRKNPANRMLVMRLEQDEMDPTTWARSAGGVLVFPALCAVCGLQKRSWAPGMAGGGCMCGDVATPATDLNAGRAPSLRMPVAPLGLDDEGFIVARDKFTNQAAICQAA